MVAFQLVNAVGEPRVVHQVTHEMVIVKEDQYRGEGTEALTFLHRSTPFLRC